MIGQAVSHYKILQKLGEGGSGVVYKALDEKLNRIVALKFFHDQPFANREQKAFLTREAQAAAALNHPNIRTIYEIDETDQGLFMSMAFIEGLSLKNKLQDGPLNLETRVSVACQVADGLETAHNHGIIHRNLNSANILITDHGLAKILNFGLASPSAETGSTIKSASISTTAYLSPEQLRYEKIDQRTDIWSWGAVFYEILTGKLPFKGQQSLEDVFAIQEEIAHRIAQALKIELTDEEKQAIEKTPTRSIEAYDFYLRGRRFFYRHTRKYTHHAITMFSRAIEKDPRYSRAYAGKADCHSYLFWYFGGSAADLDQAEKDSQTALRLDPSLSEAHAARGLALSLSKRFAEAEKEFEKAIELNPNLFEAYYFYARACFVQGKYEKAKDLYLTASRVNPADFQSPALLAFLYKTMGQEEKMGPVLHEALDKVERHLALNPDDSRAIYLGADILIRLGEKQKAMDYLKRLAATERDEPYLLYGLACLYSLIGKAEEAVYYLTKSVEVGFAHRQYLEKDSDFDPIREHPSYQALIRDLKAREKD